VLLAQAALAEQVLAEQVLAARLVAGPVLPRGHRGSGLQS
jgi:hypothetical protein